MIVRKLTKRGQKVIQKEITRGESKVKIDTELGTGHYRTAIVHGNEDYRKAFEQPRKP